MYYGVYAMFLSLGVVAIGVDCWSVFTFLPLIKTVLINYYVQVHVRRFNPTICGMAPLAVVGSHNEVSQVADHTAKQEFNMSRAPMAFFNSVDNGDLINRYVSQISCRKQTVLNMNHRFSQDMSLVDRELPTAVYTTTFGISVMRVLQYSSIF